MLIVNVTNEETGAAVPGATIEALGETNDEGLYEGPHVGGAAIGRTDDAGRVALHVQSGSALTVIAYNEEDDQVAPSWIDLEPLQPDESRVVVFRIRVGYDLRIVGEVVAAENGLPVRGARVCFVDLGLGEFDPPHTEVRTDVDGVFDVRLPSWSELSGHVDAEGFGVVSLLPQEGFDRPEQPLRIELERGATLCGEVVGRAGVPMPGLAVVVSPLRLAGESLAGGLGELDHVRWSVRTSADGSFAIHDLPSGRFLRVELLRDSNLIRRDEIVLKPGEMRSVELRVGSGATLYGEAVLEDGGQPYGRRAIWLVQGDGCVLLDEIEDPFAYTETDGEGRFVFRDVPEGTWLVGPALSADLQVAPLSLSVDIGQGQRRIEVVVVVQRGRYLNGTVRTPDGELVHGATVRARLQDGEIAVEAFSDIDGAFSLGPVVSGGYDVVADYPGYVSSGAVEALTGSRSIELRLRCGGSLRGRVLEARSGRPLAEVATRLELKSEQATYESDSDWEGYFSFSGIGEGRYELTATAGRLVGYVPNLELSSTREISGLHVAMEPGAVLMIRCRGYEGDLYVDVNGGGARELRLLPSGSSLEMVRLPGRTEVRLCTRSDEARVVLDRRIVDLRARERANVVLDAGRRDRASPR